ncbi:hypothetical protein, unlikely [Trypanosoma brucei gambiense DAL972]|uniref:Uncharacterized protein n=1 Tax=Trypanosoma brucei gambiense (strain MHOM/CI/86/DAL972) TaxID=679716 RepID=D0A0V6_TRYB9|nr:hypothetical protein, unlikely [Trypanosoma brucei gambiense DAL972]CBH16864.1 hypothetical protein, unlikely [Trypanosoma brucei gambiense DAL972]|eukprot:XP_011779128.1 hypothetical protein, unlikely [Trypanosoma brucei gambiense DAL972]
MCAMKRVLSHPVTQHYLSHRYIYEATIIITIIIIIIIITIIIITFYFCYLKRTGLVIFPFLLSPLWKVPYLYAFDKRSTTVQSLFSTCLPRLQFLSIASLCSGMH